MFKERSRANVGILTIENLLKLLLGFGVNALAARILGVEAFGKYNFVLGFAYIFFPIYSFGLDELLIKNFLTCKDDISRYLGSAISLRLLGGLIGGALCLIFYFLSGGDDQEVFLILSLFCVTFLFKSLDSFNNYFQSKTLESEPAKLRVFFFFLLSLGKISILLLYPSWKTLLIISAFEVPLFGAAYVLTFKRLFKKIQTKLSLDKEVLLEFSKKGGLVVTMLFFIAAFKRIDYIYLKNILGDGQLGYYSAVARLCDLWVFIPSIMIVTFLPQAAAQLKSSPNEFYRIAGKAYRITFFLSLGLAGSIYFLKSVLIKGFFGEEYLQSIPLFFIYSVVLIFEFNNAIRIRHLIFKDKYKLALVILFVFLLTQVILSYFFITRYGTVGAIYSTLLAQTIPLLFFVWDKDVRFGVTTQANFLRSPIREVKSWLL